MTDPTTEAGPRRFQWAGEIERAAPDAHTAEDLEEAEAFASPARAHLHVEDGEAAALGAPDVRPWELSDRDRAIYEAGFIDGHLAREPELVSVGNALKQAEDDADRFYRAAFDHDYHDCAVHENRGRYRGTATRLAADDRY